MSDHLGISPVGPLPVAMASRHSDFVKFSHSCVRTPLHPTSKAPMPLYERKMRDKGKDGDDAEDEEGGGDDDAEGGEADDERSRLSPTKKPPLDGGIEMSGERSVSYCNNYV